MKKTLKLIIALALVLSCVVALVSCGGPKPKLNLKKAEANLEDNGYEVDFEEYDKGDNPIIRAALYAENEDGDWIEITKFDTKKLAKLSYKALVLEIENKIDELKLQLKTYKYTLRKFDKDFGSFEIKYLEEMISDTKDQIDALKDSLDCIGRSGKYVWEASSKNVIKDTKR